MMGLTKLQVLFCAALVLLAFQIAVAENLPTVDGTQQDDVIDENWPGRGSEKAGKAEQINGKGGADEIHGGGGDDIIEGGGEDDTIHGDPGNDDIQGDQGKDHIYGGAGNDTLHGGPHEDYLDGNEGADTLDGGTNSDLIIGRDGNDTLIGGAGPDFIVIIGNSLQGYTIHGDSDTPNTGNVGDDLLFFARDVNPDNFMHKSITKPNGDDYQFTELEFGLHTQQAVTLDIPAEIEAERLRHVQAFATGSGNDTITGSDYAGTSTYSARFFHSGNPMFVGELFFTHAGNDMIDTGGGHDFVDAGAGNDTIICPGDGQFHVITGSGDDTVRFNAADLTGPGGAGRTTIVYDLSSGDRLEVLGNTTVAKFEKVDVSDDDQIKTMIKFDHPNDDRDRKENEFLLLGARTAQVEIKAFAGGVVITAGPQKVGPVKGPEKGPDKGPGKGPAISPDKKKR